MKRKRELSNSACRNKRRSGLVARVPSVRYWSPSIRGTASAVRQRLCPQLATRPPLRPRNRLRSQRRHPRPRRITLTPLISRLSTGDLPVTTRRISSHWRCNVRRSQRQPHRIDQALPRHSLGVPFAHTEMPEHNEAAGPNSAGPKQKQDRAAAVSQTVRLYDDERRMHLLPTSRMLSLDRRAQPLKADLRTDPRKSRHRLATTLSRSQLSIVPYSKTGHHRPARHTADRRAAQRPTRPDPVSEALHLSRTLRRRRRAPTSRSPTRTLLRLHPPSRNGNSSYFVPDSKRSSVSEAPLGSEHKGQRAIAGVELWLQQSAIRT